MLLAKAEGEAGKAKGFEGNDLETKNKVFDTIGDYPIVPHSFKHF